MSEWIPVVARKPERGIRVIAARSGFVIGDCYYGTAEIVLKYLDDPEYADRQMQVRWRHSQTGEPVKLHQLPTYWQPLPEPPKA